MTVLVAEIIEPRDAEPLYSDLLFLSHFLFDQTNSLEHIGYIIQPPHLSLKLTAIPVAKDYSQVVLRLFPALFIEQLYQIQTQYRQALLPFILTEVKVLQLIEHKVLLYPFTIIIQTVAQIQTLTPAFEVRAKLLQAPLQLVYTKPFEVVLVFSVYYTL